MDIKFEEFRKACKYHDDEKEYEHPVCTLPFEDAGYQYNEEDVVCNEKNCPFMKADQVPESNKKEYLMQYECCNCGTRFTKNVPIGKTASGKAGKCPYCNVPDGLTNGGWAHKIIGAYKPGNCRGV